MQNPVLKIEDEDFREEVLNILKAIRDVGGRIIFTDKRYSFGCLDVILCSALLLVVFLGLMI